MVTKDMVNLKFKTIADSGMIEIHCGDEIIGRCFLPKSSMLKIKHNLRKKEMMIMKLKGMM